MVAGSDCAGGADGEKDAGVFRLGEPSIYACPECHGVLLQMKDAVPPRFRCHTGHAYTLERLLSEMDEAIGETLWSAIRALDERAMLLRHAMEHLPEGQAAMRGGRLVFAGPPDIQRGGSTRFRKGRR